MHSASWPKLHENVNAVVWCLQKARFTAIQEKSICPQYSDACSFHRFNLCITICVILKICIFHFFLYLQVFYYYYYYYHFVDRQCLTQGFLINPLVASQKQGNHLTWESMLIAHIFFRWVKQKWTASLSLCASRSSVRWNLRPWMLWTSLVVSEPGATVICEPSKLATPKMMNASLQWHPLSPPQSGQLQVRVIKAKLALNKPTMVSRKLVFCLPKIIKITENPSDVDVFDNCRAVSANQCLFLLHELLFDVSIFCRRIITVVITCELCQIIPLYFGYGAWFSYPWDASESKAMNPIENFK